MIKVDTAGARAHLALEMKKVQENLVMAYRIAGEEAVRQQNLSHKYLNQTGNLSASVGYSVLFNGKVIDDGGFEGAGPEGASAGQMYLQQLIGENQTGLVLIVVAGMNYAKYVEDMGLDVLTSAELKAGQILPELLKQL